MSLPSDRSGLWRSRWAAIGAAVAITFGAGGLVAVNASGGEESTTVMIDPVRILDSRDPTNVGLPGPFVSQVSQKLQVTGSIPTTTGIQTVVPDWATGVLLNVTTVFSTANGFISIRPGDATGLPSTSSLNFKAGDVVPNAVQVALPTGSTVIKSPNFGQIDITYDAYGAAGNTTDILIDVVGYTTTDLLDTILTALPFATSAQEGSVGLSQLEQDVVSVQLTAPFDGHVTLNTSTNAWAGVAGWGAHCSITNNGIWDWAYVQRWESAGVGNRGMLAGTRVVPVAGGATYRFALRCQALASNSDPNVQAVLYDSVITAIYTPTP